MRTAKALCSPGCGPARRRTAVVSIAAATLLRANHPNPFNPQTTISFALLEACRVEIAI